MGAEKELVNLFDMSQNYKNYRNVLTTASLPVIPYVGILLNWFTLFPGLFPRDLTALEEVPTFLDNDNKIVNFGKLRDLWKILSQISKFQVWTMNCNLTCQASKYKIVVNPPLSALLKSMPQLSERELFELSEQYEPPKKKR